MNKINVNQLLRVSKNTHRVPLAKTGALITSTIPSANIKVDGREITVFGSQKDANLAFTKGSGGFVSKSKPVPTTVKLSEVSATLSYDGKTASIGFPGFSLAGEGALTDQNRAVDFGSVNSHEDKLTVASKDNGLAFDIVIGAQRSEYLYTFDFVMDSSVKAVAEGKKFLLKDTNGGNVFAITGIHMISAGGCISTACEAFITSDGKCAIRADSSFVSEYILKGKVHVMLEVSGCVSPMIKLESFRGGRSAQPINDMYVFGYKNKQEYMVKATIKAKEIAGELISRQGENFETLFTLNFDKTHAKNFSEGFRVYDGEEGNLIKSQDFDSALASITVDITKKVKSAIEALNAGKDVKDIALEFKYSCTPISTSDDEYAGEELADNYVEVHGIYSSDTSSRPYIGSKFASLGEVKDGTPFIEKELARSGKSRINIFEGSLQHGFSLGSIASNAFRVPLSMFYDSRLLTQKLERPKTVGLPKGWMLNLSQCLIKDRVNANKAKGIKEVLYIDGENNTHVLTEKWFYKDGDDKEIVVAKDEVYLGNDQKLKFKDKGGIVHDVAYQVDSDDGLAFVSTNSRLNYTKQSDMKMEKAFKLVSADKTKEYKVAQSKNGKVKVTFFRNGGAEDRGSRDDVFPEYRNAANKKFTATKILSIKDVYFKNGIAYEKGQGTTNPLSSTTIECELLNKGGEYFVQGIDTLYEATFAYDNQIISAVAFDTNDDEIELECATSVDVTSDTDIPDYCESEDIANVKAQIKQCEDYVNELQDQCESYSASIASLKAQLKKQRFLHSLNDSASKCQTKVSEINEKYVKYGDSEEEETDTSNYKLHSRNARYYSEQYQESSYDFQVASLNKQIDEHNAALQKVYEKISDYQIQLNNLYELRDSCIESQKEGAQDYVYDKEGNLLGFDYYGRLVYLSDRYENEIALSYVDDKLVEISSAKQRIVLHYNKGNELDYVVDPTGRKTEFGCSGSKFIVTRRDEKGEKEATAFTFDDNYRLTSIKDSIGYSFAFSWTDFAVSSIINESRVTSIEEGGVNLGGWKTLSTTLITNSGDCVTVTDKEAGTTNSYHLDYEGRLISQSYRDEDDASKGSASVSCFDDGKEILELSYEDKDLVAEVALGGGYASTIEKTIGFGTALVDISRLSDREMLALSLDFSGLEQSQIKNNAVCFKVASGGTEKTFTFKKIPQGVLAVPAIIEGRSGSATMTAAFSKAVDLGALKKIGVYRAEATINEYDDDGHMVSSTTKEGTTSFADFDGDNPTTCTVTDRYGVKRTSRALFDASGRPVYEEDGDGNCRETYYDEKGNVVETREYNKANSSLSKVSRTSYDEEGNATDFGGVMRDKNGNYPQEKATYLPGTDVVSSIKRPNGQVIVYGHDFNTGLLTEMASDANGQDNATQYGYLANRLVSLAHHGVKFSYALDCRGRKTSIKLNGTKLVTSKYEDNYSDDKVTNGQKVTTAYIDGFESATITDKDGDLISTVTNDGDVIDYKYDDRDRLVEVVRNNGEETALTAYDEEDRIISNEYKIGGEVTVEDFKYDEQGRVVAKFEAGGPATSVTDFKYADGQSDRIEELLIGKNRHRFEYDALGRVTRKELFDDKQSLIDESIEYLRYGENSLDLIKEHDVRIGGVMSDATEYEYDVFGNITSVKRGEYETRYQYDELGRLVREDNPLLDITCVYKYDAGGNILLKKEYKYSLEDRLYSPTLVPYTYASKESKDQLTSFDGRAIEYDLMGRMTSIGGHKLAWDGKGRMVCYDDAVYTYGLNGIRTSKIVKGTKTTYYVVNSKIIAETSGGREITYQYSLNKLVGFTLNGTEYIYERNIQGDILRIYEKSDLSLVAEYHYDAYGNHKVINYTGDKIGDANPFRYRGYYFDEETGLYYLNARYYSPKIGRFISPDELSILDETRSEINGLNLYMYCADNPVMNVDPTGRDWWSNLWSGVGNWFSQNWTKLVIGAAFIAAGVLVTAFTAGAGVGFAAAFGSALVSSLGQTAISTAISAGIGAITGAIAGGAQGALNGFLNGIANGFMWGGIFSGVSQIISGGFRIAANCGFPAGPQSGIYFGGSSMKILSPDMNKWELAGGTLFKIGKIFRLDAGGWFGLHFHASLLNNVHVPLGALIGGIIGGISD